MDAVPQDAFATLGLAEEGGEGLTGLARAPLEAGVNEMMAAQADAAREATGTTRNGFRERRLETQVGTITLGMPKLRRGTYFPDGLVERWGRVDRAAVCAAAETRALGASTRKVGRVLERMGADRLSRDAASRICAALDAEAAGLRPRRLPPMRLPHLWVDATYVPCRRNGHGAAAAVVAAIAVGEDGVRRVVGPACVDAGSHASRKGLLRGLRERGLPGAQCVTSDAHGGIARAVRELFPGAAWQRCVVHLERDVIDACPTRAKRAAAGRVLHA
ncbi:transposase, partial [Olsenella sp. An270]|uniref:IS256 family transposase n=1 Tax=Olsenella sp. An270 TaxID=1965615 RepID=UPI000B569D95